MSVIPSIRLEYVPFISLSTRVSVPSIVILFRLILFRLTHSSVSLLVSRDYSDLDYFSLPSHSIRVSLQFVPTNSTICSLHLIQFDRVCSFSHPTQLMVLIRPILGKYPVFHSPDTTISQTPSQLSRSTRLWLPLHPYQLDSLSIYFTELNRTCSSFHPIIILKPLVPYNSTVWILNLIQDNHTPLIKPDSVGSALQVSSPSPSLHSTQSGLLVISSNSPSQTPYPIELNRVCT